MRALLPLGLSFILVLAACDRPAEPATEVAPPAPPAALAEPASVAPAASTPRPAEASKALIALDGEGLRLVDPVSGSTRALSFGAPAAATLETLTRLRGEGPERSTNPDCGAGALEFARWEDGLNLVLQEDRFVGWSVNAPAGRSSLKTMSGVGLGSTRRELEDAYAVKVETTTLGQEFSAGGLTGILASPAPDARVTDLWAGTSCVFR
jgi:hypothetical protein